MQDLFMTKKRWRKIKKKNLTFSRLTASVDMEFFFNMKNFGIVSGRQ